MASDLQGRLQQSLWDAGLTADAEIVQDAGGWRLELLAEASDLEDCFHGMARHLGATGRPALVRNGLSTVTVVTGTPTFSRLIDSALQQVLAERAAQLLHVTMHAHRAALLVEDDHGPDLVRLVHDCIADGVSAHLGAA